jgi:hypothetical protein
VTDCQEAGVDFGVPRIEPFGAPAMPPAAGTGAQASH